MPAQRRIRRTHDVVARLSATGVFYQLQRLILRRWHRYRGWPVQPRRASWRRIPSTKMAPPWSGSRTTYNCWTWPTTSSVSVWTADALGMPMAGVSTRGATMRARKTGVGMLPRRRRIAGLRWGAVAVLLARSRGLGLDGLTQKG